MTRNKAAIIGLSALALLATSVFVTSGAQATGAHVAQFTCLENGVNVHCTGHGEEAKRHGSEQTTHSWTAGFATVTCKNVSFNVTTDDDGKSTTAPTQPSYSECTATGGLTAHVNMNGCEYEFHVETDNLDRTEETEYEGSAELNCAPGKSVTVEITLAAGGAKCLIHIAEQTTIKPIRFRNMNTNPVDVTVEAVNASATAQFTGVGPGSLFEDCGVFAENGTSKYTGNTTVRATNTAGAFIGSKVD